MKTRTDLGIVVRTLAVSAMLALVLPTGGAVADSDKPMLVNLSPEEAKLLKSVYDRDQFIHQLFAGQKGLSLLNSALSSWVSGPVKLLLSWNNGLLKGWGIANKNLAVIEKHATCDDLLTPVIDNSPNQEFFNDLRDIRDCE